MKTRYLSTVCAVLILAATIMPQVGAASVEPGKNAQEDEPDPTITLGILVEMTYYDPALCAEEPINCMGDPTKTAGDFNVADWYEQGIACPAELPMGTVITLDSYGDLTCIDRGGNIQITSQGVFRLDLLHHHESGPIPRQIEPATVTLTGETIARILEAHPNPFVEPEYDFACPATTCSEIFYTYGQMVPGSSGNLYAHLAVDFWTGPDGPVYAADSGTVTLSGVIDQSGQRCGGVIDIDHGNEWETRYCHLTERYVGEDEWVEQGQLIGLAGNSGYTLEGEHLHLVLNHNDAPLNFLNFLDQRAESYYPIDLTNLKRQLAANNIALQITTPDPLAVAVADLEAESDDLEVVEPEPTPAPQPQVAEVSEDKEAGQSEPEIGEIAEDSADGEKPAGIPAEIVEETPEETIPVFLAAPVLELEDKTAGSL